MNENKLIWEQVKTELSTDPAIDFNIYNYYIANSELLTIEDGECYIVAQTEFGKSILRNIDAKIKTIIFKITSHNYTTKYLSKDEANLDFLKESSEQKLIEQNKILEKESSRQFSFENFVKGDSNREAYHAALAVTLELGKKWNPLFIYGDSGLGKTHLLHAVENKIDEIYNDAQRVKYLSSEEFGKIIIDIITKGHDSIEQFKTSFDDYSVLLIDDIQFLSKRNKTNEIFFHIFNSYIENDKQIIITSDKYPEELNGFEQRIISRFNYGLSVGLDSPDFETALKILHTKIENKNLEAEFSEEVLEYIAYNFNSDVRKLEGAINKLLFNAILYKKEARGIITIKDVERAFKHVPVKNNEKLTVKKIKEVVAEHYNINMKVISGKSRVSNVIVARQLAMYFARTLLDKSFSSIGAEFSNKDHTTVMNACKKIERLIKNDVDFKKNVNILKNKLK